MDGLASYLLMAAAVIVACVIFNRISSKLGIPTLLAFILLGMFFGADGVIKIQFDDYAFAEQICSIALIFIMFYGGFGTKWSAAQPIVVKAVLLSSLGTIITAGLVGLFCRFVLKIALLESFLIGAVICSTDAASVFSILRSKRLNLRYHTASLLEVESGSNDPFSYMLTVVVLSIMDGKVAGGAFAYMLFAQVAYGVAFGAAIAVVSMFFLRKFRFSTAGFDAIFMVAVAIISYAAPTYFGGNGYLSAYIVGIVLGNQRIEQKRALVNFFDATTGLMQMVLFFLLGLIALPSQLPGVALTGLWVALFLTFVARPAAVFAILSPFKSNLNQQILVSWAGMRGAASIVFAIMAVIDPAVIKHDIFHIVFFIVLFSILFQGTLIPFAAKALRMTDDESDVMKTFTDYVDEVPIQFIQSTVSASHPWVGLEVRELVLPPESLLVLLIRGSRKIVPNGKTVLTKGDTLVLSGKATNRIDGVRLYERVISKGDDWANKTLSEIPSGQDLIIMIRRGEEILIPKGNTRLLERDTLVINGTTAG